MTEAEAEILPVGHKTTGPITMTEAEADILPVGHEATGPITMTEAEAEILPVGHETTGYGITNNVTDEDVDLPVGHGITNDDSDEHVDFSNERHEDVDLPDSATEAGGDREHSVVADSNKCYPISNNYPID